MPKESSLSALGSAGSLDAPGRLITNRLSLSAQYGIERWYPNLPETLPWQDVSHACH